MGLLRDGMGPRIVCFCALFALVVALNNGLGLTPQMGWNSWNHFGCDGYNYVNIDDCWSEYNRDAKGALVPDQSKFPDAEGQSLQSLIDYIHQQGLLFGLYSDAGNLTCAKHDPGSLGYETIDAQTWTDWKVDYLKYDNCNNEHLRALQRYPPMRDALNATGRPLFFSLCEWGREEVPTWGRAVGNSWRTTPDIKDEWHSMLENLYRNNLAADFAGPGGWNDPDMLEVGNGGMTTTEYRSHFSLWCLMKAPLIIGCDVNNMDEDTRTILLNTEAIAVNQDPRGIQGRLVRSPTTTTSVWTGPLVDGNVAVILFNTGPDPASITLKWNDMNILPTTEVLLRDLWAHQDLGVFKTSYTASVASHDVLMLRVIPSYAINYPPQTE